MKHEFNVTLKKLEGKMNWTVIYIPKCIMKHYNVKGRMKIKGEIDTNTFTGTLLPSRNGHYLVYNKKLEEMCGKKRGEEVHVVFKRDARSEEIIIPEFINEKLSKKALTSIKTLPNYIKREKINYIMSAKKEETKVRRLKKWLSEIS